jgi:phage terminase small subunit
MSERQRHLTVKQERFAQIFVEIGNASEAYRQSYLPKQLSPNGVKCEGYKLVHHPAVMERIDELREIRQSDMEWSRDRLIYELFQRSKEARDAAQFSASIKALEVIGKLSGVLVDKVEHTGNVNHAHYAQLTIEQLEQLALQGAQAAKELEPGVVEGVLG